MNIPYGKSEGKTLTNDPPEVEPGRSQSSVAREAIKKIGRNCRCRSEHGKAVHSPADSNACPRKRVLDRLTVQYQGAHGEDDSGPAAEKSVLGFVDAVVLLDVVVAEPVIEEMAPYFSAENADHRS